MRAACACTCRTASSVSQLHRVSSGIHMQHLLDSLTHLRCRLAYLMSRVWWFLRRPATHNTGVALWDRGQILLVRTGGRSALSLPGGSVGPGESSNEAARRQLRAELGLCLAAGDLQMVGQERLRCESRRDTMDIWELGGRRRPPIRVDSRKVVWAGWMAPEEALKRRLLPPVRLYLSRKKVGLPRDGSSGRPSATELAVKEMGLPLASGPRIRRADLRRDTPSRGAPGGVPIIAARIQPPG